MIDPTRVSFEDESGRTRPERSPDSKLTQWLIAASGGYIKDRKQANGALLCFVAFILLLSLFLFFRGSNTEIQSPNENLINTPQPAEGEISR